MAQLDKIVDEYMSKNPQVRLSYQDGLINRRALARRIIEEEKSLSKLQFEALIAVLRRYESKSDTKSSLACKSGSKDKSSNKSNSKILSDFSILIKDGITIANLAKSRDALSQIEKILPKISYEKNQTFKIVMGSESIKLFLDSKNRGLIDIYIQKKDILYLKDNLAEISLTYSESASSEKGILSYLSTTLSMQEITVEEFLTCSPELLLYVNGSDSLKAYKILKEMQQK